jgi:radical SAM superfamily enzyme YgiQ (UPF0313 family)
MGRAGFQSVFIGIESPNEEALKETKKLQNVRPRAGSLLERVHRIQNHGLDVWCGMIVGFDSDDASVFDALPRFLEQSHIGNALVGLLHAIPTTPLHARLKAEGRLSSNADGELYGTNVIPLGLDRKDLRDGFVRVMQRLYTPQAYFSRVDSLFLERRFKFAVHGLDYWRTHRWQWLTRYAANFLRFAVLSTRLLRHVDNRELRAAYRQRLQQIVRQRYAEPHILFIYAIKITMHYHYHSLVNAAEGAVPEGLRSFSRDASEGDRDSWERRPAA